MSHQIAKLLLEKANTFLGRADAVRSAVDLGMPLKQIEEYLDWLEMAEGGGPKADKHNEPPADNSSNAN